MPSHQPIIVEENFPVSREELWKAITEHQEMIQWFFEMIPDFKPELDFTTEFTVTNEDRRFTHLWKVIDIIPNEKMVLEWRYDEYPGDGRVVFEIEGHKSGSRLKLINYGLETFPKDIPEFKYESCIGGWEYFIKGRLKSYLEN